MKNLIQFSLVCLVIISSYVFYNKYLAKKDRNSKEVFSVGNDFIKKSENNQIKNLKYEINLNENNQYIISSVFSELIKSNDHELVEMQIVEAQFLDKKQLALFIKAENASYNAQNYNTIFRTNIQSNI